MDRSGLRKIAMNALLDHLEINLLQNGHHTDCCAELLSRQGAFYEDGDQFVYSMAFGCCMVEVYNIQDRNTMEKFNELPQCGVATHQFRGRRYGITEKRQSGEFAHCIIEKLPGE